ESDAVHNVWIDSRQPLTAPSGLETRRVDPRLYRVAGALGDRGLSATRQTITVDRDAGTGGRVARIGDGEQIGQGVTQPEATLLWIHGPQPVSFRGSAARLEQATARLSRLPNVLLYSIEPGPNELLPDQPWAWSAHSLPQSGSPYEDLSGFFRSATRQDPTRI